jgi:hypothetical protein
MLKIRMTLAWIRAAVEEAGSYEAFLTEFVVHFGRDAERQNRGSADGACQNQVSQWSDTGDGPSIF